MFPEALPEAPSCTSSTVQHVHIYLFSQLYAIYLLIRHLNVRPVAYLPAL